MCFDQLLDVAIEHLVGHVETTALIQLLLVEEEAVRAAEVADGAGRLGEDVNRFDHSVNPQALLRDAGVDIAMTYGDPNYYGKVGFLPISEAVIFPAMMVPLVLSDANLVKLADDCLAGDKILGAFSQREATEDERDDLDDRDLIYRVGTAVKIQKMLRFPDGNMRLLGQGIARIRRKRTLRTEPYMVAEIEVLEEPESHDARTMAAAGVIPQYDLSLQVPPQMIDEQWKQWQDPRVKKGLFDSGIIMPYFGAGGGRAAQRGRRTAPPGRTRAARDDEGVPDPGPALRPGSYARRGPPRPRLKNGPPTTPPDPEEAEMGSLP